MGKIIGLDVPSRTRPDRSAFNIRPRKLATWINALPRANLGETAKQIYTVLQETNQLAYPYHDRIRFLETLREPIDYVTSSMKKHFIGISLPLPDKSQKISTITKEIFSNMAQGYKIALEDMLANNLIIFDKKMLATLTHRSISYIGQNILTHYQSYSPFSVNEWAELHKLYIFAEKHKLPFLDLNGMAMKLRPGDSWKGTIISKDGAHPTHSLSQGPATEDNLKNCGYLLKCHSQVNKVVEIKKKMGW